MEPAPESQYDHFFRVNCLEQRVQDGGLAQVIHYPGGYSISNHTINEKVIKLQKWLFSWADEIWGSHFRGSLRAVVFVYDSTLQNPFERIKELHQRVHSIQPEGLVKILVGRTDLENVKQVPFSQGAKFAKEEGFHHFTEVNIKNLNDVARIERKIAELSVSSSKLHPHDFSVSEPIPFSERNAQMPLNRRISFSFAKIARPIFYVCFILSVGFVLMKYLRKKCNT